MTSTAPYRIAVRGALLLLAALGIVFGLVIVGIVPPTADTLYPRCQLHSITGLHCPGCGPTRALHAALNGHFLQALAYNSLAIVVLPVVGRSLLGSLWSWFRNQPVQVTRSSTKTTFFVVALFVAYGVLRNVPVFPLTLLAPHELGN